MFSARWFLPRMPWPSTNDRSLGWKAPWPFLEDTSASRKASPRSRLSDIQSPRRAKVQRFRLRNSCFGLPRTLSRHFFHHREPPTSFSSKVDAPQILRVSRVFRCGPDGLHLMQTVCVCVCDLSQDPDFSDLVASRSAQWCVSPFVLDGFCRTSTSPLGWTQTVGQLKMMMMMMWTELRSFDSLSLKLASLIS